MTTRDHAEVLSGTLDAYERLEFPRGGYRLVVVDDGSRDETPRMLASRASRLPLVPLRAPSLGQNAARNLALAHLEGDWAVFTDDDARPRSDWLVRIREAADAHPEAEVIAGTVLPRFEVEPADWVLRAVRRGPSFAWVERAADGWLDPTEAVGPSVAIRTTRFGAGLRFDPSIGPDGSGQYPMGAETELLLRLQREGARAWYAKQAVVEHFVRAAQAEEPALLRRAYRYGRGRWRLRTSRLARARLRVRGVPTSLVADLLARRLTWSGARRRGDAETALRAAWRIAYLAGHVDEIRRERGLEPGLGRLAALVPPALRELLAASGPATALPARPCADSRARPAVARGPP